MKITRLTGEAWAAWNASYTEPHVEVYRVLGAALYQHAMRERIQSLFDELDEQNARLDALLASRVSPTRFEDDGCLVQSPAAMPSLV
jgi:hypothetical protein